MIIRSYSKKDIKRINELGNIFPNYHFKLDVFSKCTVLDYNGYVIGFAIYSIMYDRAEIDYIVIDKEYQNMGYAKKIMDSIINDCVTNRCKNITLEVNINNKSAIRLYEKYGFKKISTRKEYYNESDAYLMEKKL